MDGMGSFGSKMMTPAHKVTTKETRKRATKIDPRIGKITPNLVNTELGILPLDELPVPVRVSRA